MYKKIILFCVIALLDNTYTAQAALPTCGSDGLLNVGILLENLPYSAYDPFTNAPFGFDVDLICALARSLGYNINFEFFTSNLAGQLALLAGDIDIYANSAIDLNDTFLSSFNGLVTDMSHITSTGDAQSASASPLRGYFFNAACCPLIRLFESALTNLVENGTYANLVQKQRQDPRQAGFLTGLGQFSFTPTGPNKLVEPLEFHSTLAGTISTGCTGPRPSLPVSTCLSQFVINNTPCSFTFTGATGGFGG